MTKVYLDTQYPKNLGTILQALHEMQYPKQYEIIRTNDFGGIKDANPVIFLFDRSKKGLDIVTEKHWDAGYRVFAFKNTLVTKFDPYQLCLSVVSFWPKMLDIIDGDTSPFIVTYKYRGSVLSKVK